jgi:hypothetical protein
MFSPLPPELVSLEGKVHFVQQINPNEFHMSCPSCGVQPHHSDSHPSDRFIVWIESRLSGKPFGMCRTCGWKWSSDKQDAVWTDEEKAAFAAKRRELNQREEERIRLYAETVVMKQAIYERYNQNIKKSTYAWRWLESRGLNSKEWIDYLKIGIFEDYKCRGYASTYYSPAITMAVWGLDNKVENIKLRVTEAKHPNDRFRNLYKTNAQHPYFPNRDERIASKVAIFEGEMKSVTVAMYGKLPDDVQIIGTQGKGIGSRMVYKLEKAETVYLCLDPDTYEPNTKGETTIMQAARKFGLERVRIIPCKTKVDDAILQGFNLRNAFNMAVRPQSLGLK